MAGPRLTQRSPASHTLSARNLASRTTAPLGSDATVTLSSLNLSRATLAERYTLPQFRLRVSGGPDQGKQAVFAQRVVVIGTSVDADFVLTDAATSREHIRITGDRVGYRLRDLDSKNGTWFAGSRAVELLLGPAATLRLGQTELQYEQLADMHEIALARETQLWGLQGHSEAMRDVFARISLLGALPDPVVIEGEDGTGKRTTALAIHRVSSRAEQDVEYLDCSTADWSALAAELVPSGPLWQRAAAGSLILLDADEITLGDQAKIVATLAALTDAGTAPRLVATLSLPLPNAVREQRLSKDFAKLFAGRRLHLPPLRRRTEDIAPLVQAMLAELEQLHPEVGPLVLSFETMQALQSYAWPGNVRELRRHLQAAVGLAVSAVAPLAVVGPAVSAPSAPDNLSQVSIPFAEARARCLSEFERRYISDVLAAAGQQSAVAAQLAGLSKVSFESLAARIHGIEEKS